MEAGETDEIAVFYSNKSTRSIYTLGANDGADSSDRGDFAFAAIRRMASRRSSASMIASSSLASHSSNSAIDAGAGAFVDPKCLVLRLTLADAGSRGWRWRGERCGPETVCGRGDGKSRAPLFQCGVSGGFGAVSGILQGDGRGDGGENNSEDRCDCDAEVTTAPPLIHALPSASARAPAPQSELSEGEAKLRSLVITT